MIMAPLSLHRGAKGARGPHHWPPVCTRPPFIEFIARSRVIALSTQKSRHVLAACFLQTDRVAATHDLLRCYLKRVSSELFNFDVFPSSVWKHLCCQQSLNNFLSASHLPHVCCLYSAPVVMELSSAVVVHRWWKAAGHVLSTVHTPCLHYINFAHTAGTMPPASTGRRVSTSSRLNTVPSLKTQLKLHHQTHLQFAATVIPYLMLNLVPQFLSAPAPPLTCAHWIARSEPQRCCCTGAWRSTAGHTARRAPATAPPRGGCRAPQSAGQQQLRRHPLHHWQQLPRTPWLSHGAQATRDQ
jgi:hypothetical protein